MNRRHFLTSTAAGRGAARAPAVVRGQEPIKVGVLLPFSKAFAVLGENTLAGFTLGMKEFGSEVAGRRVTVVKEDDTADPSVGVSKRRKLLDKDEVDVIVGTVHSGVAAAIRNPIVE